MKKESAAFCAHRADTFIIGRILKMILLCACIGTSSLASANIIYDEGVSGDAAGDDGWGTVIGTDLGTLSLGTSTVIGTTVGGIDPLGVDGDEDWFKFTIDANRTLVSIVLASYGGDGSGNIGWALGTTIQGDHRFVSTAQIGTDLLNTSFLGVIRPIGPGSYAFKMGTGTNTNTYELDFNVASVPEPTTLTLLGLGLAGLGVARRRKTA